MSDTSIIMHRFEKDNRYYVYDTGTNSIFEVTKDIYKDLCVLERLGVEEFKRQYESSKLMFLFKKGYLCHTPTLNICHPHYDLIDSLIDNRLSHLVLQITRDCNFNCRYCGFSGDGKYRRKHSSNYMNQEVAQKAVNYFFEHSTNSNKVSICFYGGEPLLNFELIKYIVKYSKEKFFSTELNFHMTTNASLLSEEVVLYLENNNINLLISLDGPKDIQDAHRLFYYNGMGTFDIVMKNVNNIINNHSEYFDKYVKFNPVMLSPQEKKEIEYFFVNELKIPKDKISIRNANLKGIDYISDYISRDGEDPNMVLFDDEIYEENQMILKEKIQLTSPWQHNGPCIPGVDRLFVSCDGNFYPCEKVPEIGCVQIGNVDNGVNIQKVKELSNIGNLTSEECNNCWAKHFCMICLASCIDYKTNTVSRELKLQECRKTCYNVDLFLKKYVEQEKC